MGEPFLVVDLSKTDVCDIDQDRFNFMLDVAAAMLNLEETHPSGKATKSLKWDIMQSDGFKLVREVLRSRVQGTLSGHRAVLCAEQSGVHLVQKTRYISAVADPIELSELG